ncbi:hypothetical protein Vafri_20826 [Volvox africanus]|uniref:Uncharacterized protein n=1 Tax=Volvox africanus TaxID=51714 RepID=A0A8J4BT71_9CHLO|nr:hypothetical protein Vafri_20826 [Volvox africanus]
MARPAVSDNLSTVWQQTESDVEALRAHIQVVMQGGDDAAERQAFEHIRALLNRIKMCSVIARSASQDQERQHALRQHQAVQAVQQQQRAARAAALQQAQAQAQAQAPDGQGRVAAAPAPAASLPAAGAGPGPGPVSEGGPGAAASQQQSAQAQTQLASIQLQQEQLKQQLQLQQQQQQQAAAAGAAAMAAAAAAAVGRPPASNMMAAAAAAVMAAGGIQRPAAVTRPISGGMAFSQVPVSTGARPAVYNPRELSSSCCGMGAGLRARLNEGHVVTRGDVAIVGIQGAAACGVRTGMSVSTGGVFLANWDVHLGHAVPA